MSLNPFPTTEDMERAEERLVEFLTTAVTIGLRASEAEVEFGHPVRHLIEDAIAMSVRSLAQDMLTRYGRQGEYRLNGSGLKLYWHWHRNAERQGYLGLTVGGDQDRYYPKTLPALKEFILEKRWQPYPEDN